MSGTVVASITICTRNRSAALRRTLAALERTELPPTIPVEVVVVDNASTDDTASVVASWRPGVAAARYVREPEPGLARARNAALAAARGTVILFLDDDTHPPARWLESMCRPILDGRADAVAGGVRLAPHLERPWMELPHRSWLAVTDFIDAHAPQDMVGANMAIGRHVLARVPAFDPELGLGALGQGEDSLFSWQLLRAGFRIAGALDVAVEHHFDPSRLLRESFRSAAERRGRTLAYQRYHWEHVELPNVGSRLRRRWIRFAMHMLRHRGTHRAREGMATWEMFAREEIAFLRRWQIECRRPRNYERFGLVKREEASLPRVASG